MTDSGWVKLWRKSLNSGLSQNLELWGFFCWCLLQATHKPCKIMVGYQEVYLKPGQFIFGRKKAAQELGISESKIKRLIKSLKATSRLTVQATNKFSIITIINWDTYQGAESESDRQSDRQSDQRATGKRPASDHKQEGKECKNVKTTTEGGNSGGDDGNDKCPLQQIQHIWNNAVGNNGSGMSVIVNIKPHTNRYKHIKARWKEYPDLEQWKVMADKATRSEFMNGRTKARDRPFSFDWAVRNNDNFTKILEGHYDNDKNRAGNTQDDGSNQGAGAGSKYDNIPEHVIRND